MVWHLAGVYFETCNCDVACPCVFLSAPTIGECTVLVGWHIESGSDDDVKLDGLNVALAVHSPGHMMDTKWRATAYVDNRASGAQQQSLLKIFGGQAGAILPGWSAISATCSGRRQRPSHLNTRTSPTAC